MPTFGNAGKITPRKDNNAVEVKFDQGEYLHFKVTAGGPVASFAFSCQDGPILLSKPSDFPGHPQSVYEWDKKANDVHHDEDEHVLLMNFITNRKYTYRVEHRRANNSVIELVKDMDFESTDFQDRFREALSIFRI